MSFGIGGGVAEVQIQIQSENSPISWTEWNILINFCVNIDINKVKLDLIV